MPDFKTPITVNGTQIADGAGKLRGLTIPLGQELTLAGAVTFSGAGTVKLDGASANQALLWNAGASRYEPTAVVTSVALTVPGVLFSVSGSPITTAGTLAFTLLTQVANLVFAGPSTGADAAPTFRALVVADLPLVTAAKGGTGVSNAGTITNASNTTITGGGTLALGGFTLTVPATGTAALLATANVFSVKQTIGAATGTRPGSFLELAGTESTAGTSANAFVVEATFAPGASQLTTSKQGVSFAAILTGSGGASSGGSLNALLAEAYFQQTAGTFSGIVNGLQAIVRHTNAATIAQSAGVRITPILSSTGSITDWRGLHVVGATVSSSGVITTAYGVYIAAQNATGVTTGYGIYQAGASDLNNFAGVTAFTETVSITRAGSSKIFLTIEDTNASGDTLLKLYDSSNNIGSGSYFINALKGATQQFYVRGDGIVNALTSYLVAGTQVLSTRKTGWSAATGTATRTSFATDTVTLINLARAVKALIDDFISHGAIGA